MKDGFRQCMAWLHTWSGLVVGWVLFFVFLTGTAGYATYELDRWMRPEEPLVGQVARTTPPEAQLAVARQHLQTHAANAASWTLVLPGDRSQSQLRVFWQEAPKEPGQRGRFANATLDPATGEAVSREKVRATGGGNLLYRMHYSLHYVPYQTAIHLVGVCTALMLLAIVSGVITHKKIFTDFFTFRPGKGQRSWLDAHNLISVTSLPFFLMITYSGLIFFMFQYMPAGVAAAFGTTPAAQESFFAQLYADDRAPAAGQAAPLADLTPMLQHAEAAWGAGQVAMLAVRNPGDAAATVRAFARHESGPTIDRREMRFDGVRGTPVDDARPSGASQTQGVLLALHEGRFAGPVLRVLYLLVGALGCAMIATGLVLWTAKRKVQQEKRLKAGQGVAFGYRLVEALNIGTIAGLCTAVAVYFWANRLLPVEMAGRRDWEAHAMFIAWGLALLHAGLRLSRTTSFRVWQEQLWAAAGAFALLPVLNALTTDRHLGVTVPAGDWVLAGVDLSFLILGAFFAMTARKVGRKAAASGKAPVRATPRPATPRAPTDTASAQPN